MPYASQHTLTQFGGLDEYYILVSPRTPTEMQLFYNPHN